MITYIDLINHKDNLKLLDGRKITLDSMECSASLEGKSKDKVNVIDENGNNYCVPLSLITLNKPIEDILEVLNSAYKCDSNAIHALMFNRVPCNKDLANHPFVVVDDSKTLDDKVFMVGALGLINGIVEKLTGDRVAMVWDDSSGSNKFIGFIKYIKQ